MINIRNLRRAIKTGDAKQVTEILREDPKGKLRLYGGFTPLHVAVKGGNIAVVEAMETHIDKQLSLAATKSEIEPLYTVQKVAELLSVDDNFVLDLIKTRKITGLHLDEKTVRITAGSIQRYLTKLAK